MTPCLTSWSPPAASRIPTAYAEFLRTLGSPRHFTLPGRDRSRCRAVVTLLHGDEPSGTLALMRLLQDGFVPQVDLLCCVVSVAAALHEPPLRALPAERDQNRCFHGPTDDRPGRVAAELRELLAGRTLEAILDLHNTSGAGPAYGVCVQDSDLHRALTALFGEHLMHTGLRLGTLIEGLADVAPCLTIECGGMYEARAHEVAYYGLKAFAGKDSLANLPPAVLVHHHPARLEVRQGAHVAYADSKQPGADITLRSDMDRNNFRVIESGRRVAWLGDRGLAALRVRGEDDRDRIGEFFEQVGDELRARVPFRPMMVTTNAAAAQSDCLFYAVRLDEERYAGVLHR